MYRLNSGMAGTAPSYPVCLENMRTMAPCIFFPTLPLIKKREYPRGKNRTPSTQHLVHSLVREFHSQESRSVCRDRSCHRWCHTGEESLETSTSVQLLDRAGDGRVSLGALQATLDSVDREDRDPHSNTGRATGRHDGGNTELARLAVLVLGRQPALDRLVCGEVNGRTRSITRQSHH